MKVAIMQPYFLPYIGYWQLMHAVETFVLFDDVHFINRGWINRNRLLLNGKDFMFTIPLKGASQNKRIHEIELNQEEKWQDKMIRQFEHAYRKAPHFVTIMPLLEKIIRYKDPNLAGFLLHSICHVAGYLQLDNRKIISSTTFQNQSLKGENRILDICQQFGATDYINLPGGRELYDPLAFEAHGIKLQFIASKSINYPQFDQDFVPHLSIVDMLMFCEKNQIEALLGSYQL